MHTNDIFLAWGTKSHKIKLLEKEATECFTPNLQLLCTKPIAQQDELI